MRVSDCWTSSRDVTRRCCSVRCMSVIDASTTVNRGGADGAAASATTAPRARIRALVFIRSCRCAECTAGFLQEISLDKGIEVTIQHSVHVADLHLRAVILDHLIRLQDVAPDLAAEADLFFHTSDLLELGGLFFCPQIEQPRLEHL